MNIFYIDEDPKIAASYLCDTSLRKMSLESSQMLCNAYPYIKLLSAPPTADGLTRVHSYQRHKCSTWVTSNLNHWLWLYEHGKEMVRLYKEFRGATLYIQCFYDWAKPPNLPSRVFEPPPMAMPDEFKQENIVQAYRDYYCSKWYVKNDYKNRSEPQWLS